MYTNRCRKKNPGLVIIMIDQSASMKGASEANGMPLAVIAADCINMLLREMILFATHDVGDYIEEVRDYQYVTVIGYGSEPNKPAQILVNDWISGISYSYTEEIKDTCFGRLTLPNIIKPHAGNTSTSIAPAFELVKRVLNFWKKAGHDSSEDPSPIVLNFTSCNPIDIDDYSKIYHEANDIMNISFLDGTPRIFNVMFSTHNGDEYLFPDNDKVLERDRFVQLIFSISSGITDDLRDAFDIMKEHFNHPLGRTMANNNSRLFVMSDNPNIIIYCIRLFSMSNLPFFRKLIMH